MWFSTSELRLYPIPRLDKTSQNWGMCNFSTLDLGTAFWGLFPKQLMGKDGIKIRTPPAETIAAGSVQRDRHLIEINGTNTANNNKEIWKFDHVLRR